MARKAKKKIHPMPKLGWKDQLLYWTAMLTTGIGAIIILLFPTYYRDKLTDSNPLALSWCTGERSLHNLWLGFWLFFACILIITVFYQNRTPVFGRTDIRYGPPAYPRVYPLFMKNKPKHWQSEKAKAKAVSRRRIVISVLVVSFLICAALYPLSLFGRYELLNDGTVVVFDSHNRQETHYAISNIDEVLLDTYKTAGGRYSSGSWYARVEITFDDGENCSFSVMSFADNWTDAIHRAQILKRIYGDKLHIEGTEDLWKVVLDTDMTSTEEELLYQLFEARP